MSVRRPFRLPAGLHARVVLCLLVLTVGFRSLIPTGFMPDHTAMRDGRFQLALCSSAGGASAITVALTAPQDATPHDVASHHGASHGDSSTATDTCPYWTVAHLALDLPPPPALPALAATRAVPAPILPRRTLPALPAQGPPLGSRAPPSLLG